MEKVIRFTQKDPRITFLLQQDHRIGVVINFIGDYVLNLRKEYFEALCKSIVGQQLSIKAAQTIWGRMKSSIEGITPEILIGLDPENMRMFGLSKPKVIYLKSLSEAVMDQRICFDELIHLNNDEIIDTLTAIKGIGRWTAEMFLIFSLGREDVFSEGDVGLQRAIKWLYCLEIDKDIIQVISSKWRPYRSIASLYLWEVVNTGLITKYNNFNDFAEEQSIVIKSSN